MSPGRPRDPATGRFISDTRDNSIAIRELNTQLGEAANRFEAMGRSIPTQQINNFDEGLLIGTAALVGLNAALQDVIGSQIDAAVALERQQVSLQTVTGSVEAAEAQYRRLLEVARLPGINISQALGGSAQLQAIGLSGERAAEAIGAIGNALASSGQSAQQLTPIVSGFRQINAEGKILQEDLAIITTRIPSLIPLMKEAFGGTRAEDVRKFYESIGEADRQTELFSEKLIEMLQTLPQISETAGNALENLEDTAQRLQARIGTHLLPSVKSAAAGLEDVLKAIENSEGATRSIAVFSSFAGTMLSIVTAGASVRGALGLLRPLLPALLGGPWGIAIAAVGALAGVFIAWRAATSEAREEIKNLNTFIAQNTELLNANEAAIESGSLAELRASETTIRKARDAAQARVEQLQESAKAQFDELRGIKRSGEAFDELSGSLRSTSANLKNAEAELERLNTTLKETNTEAGNLEKFETNVNNLKTAIEALNKAAQASEGIGRILRGDGVDSRGPQSDLIKVADAIISDLDTYNQIAEAARGGDERAIENLRTLQTSLRDASQSYLDALRQGLSEAKTVSDFESIIDFADNFEDAFGNVDFLRDLTSEFTALSTAAITALDDFESGLEATQAAIDELERLESLDPSAPLEASEFERRLKAAAQELTARVQAEQAAAKEREQSLRANLRLGEQLDKAATNIFKEQLEEQTDANQDATDAQLNARKEAAKEREAAADRVADRDAQRRADEVRETEKAEKEKTRIAQREARQRTRQAQREARELQRVFGTDFASGLADAFDSDLFGDSVLASLRSVESDMTAFLTDTFSVGTLAGFNAAVPFITSILRGVWESITREDLTVPEHEREPSITEAQLAAGQLGQTRGERYFNEFGPQFRLGDFDSIGDIGPLDVNILNESDLQRGPRFERELDDLKRLDTRERLGPALSRLEPAVTDIRETVAPDSVLDQIKERASELGIGNLDQLEVELGDASLSELRSINSQLGRQIEQNEREAKRALKRNASLSSIAALDDASLDVLRNSVRDAEDTPLANLLDNEQGLLRIFGAEQTAAFLVGASHLIREQEEFLRQQRRAQDPDFALVDDIRQLLTVAEVPEPEIEALLGQIDAALDREFISPELREQLVGSLSDVFDKYNINADVGEGFIARFDVLVPVWEDIRLSTQEAALYLSELRDFLLSQGVPEAQIEPLIAQFEKALADNVIRFDEGQNLFGQLNTLLSDFNIGEIDFSQFSTTLSEGFAATLDDVTLTADLADDAEASLDPDAEAKLEDGAEVDVDTGGKTLGITPADLLKTLGITVADLAKTLGITPTDLLKTLGITPTDLLKTLDITVADLAKTLGITPTDLLKTLGITPTDLLKTLDITVADLAKTLGITPTDLLKTLGITPTDLLKTLDITVADLAKTLGITPTDLLKTLGITPTDLLKTLDITVADLAKTLGITPTDLLKTLDITPADLLKTLGITPADLLKTLGITPADLLKTLDITPADLLKTLDITPADLLKTLDITPADLLKTLTVEDKAFTATLDTGFFLTDLEALWGRLIYQATQPQPQGEAAGTDGGAVEQAGDITRTPPAQTAFVDSFEAFLADTRLLLREAGGGQGGMVEGSSQLIDALEAVSTRLSEVSASEERRLLDQTSSVFERWKRAS